MTLRKKKIQHLVQLAILSLSISNAYAGRERDPHTTTTPTYEKRYEIVDGGPLSYTTESGQVSNKYPPEALAYLFMYGPSVLNSDVIAGIATFKLNSSSAEYFFEKLPGNNENNVEYSALANRWLINGIAGRGWYSSGSTNSALYSQNLDANRAAYLTGAPTLAQSRAMNAGQKTKEQLLKYLNNQKLQHMNFDFEQQYEDIACNMDGFTPNCYNNGLKRVLASFKIAAGQDVNAEGTFYGLKIEEDPDNGSIGSNPASAPSGNIDVIYYSDVLFPDFYITAGNRSALKEHEPYEEDVEFKDKLSYRYYGWLEGTFGGADMRLDERVNTFKGVLPLAISLVTNKEKTRTAIDITDKYGTLRNSLNDNSQCFFGNGKTCIVDAKTLMVEKNAKTLKLTEYSPFFLSGIREASTFKRIDFNYCLQPNISERTDVLANVEQYKIVKEFSRNSGGEITINTISPLAKNATVQLPDIIPYYFSTSFNRNEGIDGKITDDVYSQYIFNPTEASLNDGFVPQVYNLGNPLGKIEIETVGPDDTYKEWSCNESFSIPVNEMAQRYQNYCGDLPSVSNVRIDTVGSYCTASMTVKSICKVSVSKNAQNQDVYSYSWEQSDTMDIPLPEGGVPCTETCYRGPGPKTQGYCSWRETTTGRKYKS